jgi:hypothetical protein
MIFGTNDEVIEEKETLFKASDESIVFGSNDEVVEPVATAEQPVQEEIPVQVAQPVALKRPRRVVDNNEYDNLFEEAGKKYNIDPTFLKAIATTESRFDPNAKSTVFNTEGKQVPGAGGLMQFMPATAKDYGMSEQDRFDPAKSVDASARMFNDLMTFFEGQGVEGRDVQRLASAAYNGGQKKGLTKLYKKYGSEFNKHVGEIKKLDSHAKENSEYVDIVNDAYDYYSASKQPQEAPVTEEQPQEGVETSWKTPLKALAVGGLQTIANTVRGSEQSETGTGNPLAVIRSEIDKEIEGLDPKEKREARERIFDEMKEDGAFSLTLAQHDISDYNKLNLMADAFQKDEEDAVKVNKDSISKIAKFVDGIAPQGWQDEVSAAQSAETWSKDGVLKIATSVASNLPRMASMVLGPLAVVPMISEQKGAFIKDMETTADSYGIDVNREELIKKAETYGLAAGALEYVDNLVDVATAKTGIGKAVTAPIKSKLVKGVAKVMGNAALEGSVEVAQGRMQAYNAGLLVDKESMTPEKYQAVIKSLEPDDREAFEVGFLTGGVMSSTGVTVGEIVKQAKADNEAIQAKEQESVTVEEDQDTEISPDFEPMQEEEAAEGGDFIFGKDDEVVEETATEEEKVEPYKPSKLETKKLKELDEEIEGAKLLLEEGEITQEEYNKIETENKAESETITSGESARIAQEEKEAKIVEAKKEKARKKLGITKEKAVEEEVVATPEELAEKGVNLIKTGAEFGKSSDKGRDLIKSSLADKNERFGEVEVDGVERVIQTQGDKVVAVDEDGEVVKEFSGATAKKLLEIAMPNVGRKVDIKPSEVVEQVSDIKAPAEVKSELEDAREAYKEEFGVAPKESIPADQLVAEVADNKPTEVVESTITVDNETMTVGEYLGVDNDTEITAEDMVEVEGFKQAEETRKAEAEVKAKEDAEIIAKMEEVEKRQIKEKQVRAEGEARANKYLAKADKALKSEGLLYSDEIKSAQGFGITAGTKAKKIKTAKETIETSRQKSTTPRKQEKEKSNTTVKKEFLEALDKGGVSESKLNKMLEDARGKLKDRDYNAIANPSNWNLEGGKYRISYDGYEKLQAYGTGSQKRGMFTSLDESYGGHGSVDADFDENFGEEDSLWDTYFSKGGAVDADLDVTETNRLVENVRKSFPVTKNVQFRMQDNMLADEGAGAKLADIDGKPTVVIDSSLAKSDVVPKVIHEMIGHYGVDQLVKNNDPKIASDIDAIIDYERDNNTEMYQFVKENYPDAQTNGEILARAVEEISNNAFDQYGAKKDSFFKDDNMLTKIYKKLKQFFHKLLHKGQISKEMRDDLARDLIKKTAKLDPTTSKVGEVKFSKEADVIEELSTKEIKKRNKEITEAQKEVVKTEVEDIVEWDMKVGLSKAIKPITRNGVEYVYDFNEGGFRIGKDGDVVTNRNTDNETVDFLNKKLDATGLVKLARKYDAFKKFKDESTYTALYKSAKNIPKTLMKVFYDDMVDSIRVERKSLFKARDAQFKTLDSLYGNNKAVKLYEEVWGNRSETYTFSDEGDNKFEFTMGQLLNIFQQSRNKDTREQIIKQGFKFRNSLRVSQMSKGKLKEMVTRYLTETSKGISYELVANDKIVATNEKGQKSQFSLVKGKWINSKNGTAVTNADATKSMDTVAARKAIADGQFEHLNGEHKDDINRVALDQMGGEVATIENYWPRMSDFDDSNYEDPNVSKEGVLSTVASNLHSSPKSSKEFKSRKENVRTPIIVLDGWYVYEDHNKNTAKFIGRYESYLEAKRLLKATKGTFERSGQKALWKKLEDSTTEFGGKNTEQNVVNNVANFVTSQYAASVLVSPKTMTKQLISALVAATQFDNIKSAAVAITSSITSVTKWNRATKEILKHSPEGRYRHEGDFAEQVMLDQRGEKRGIVSALTTVSNTLLKWTLGKFDWAVMIGTWEASKHEAKSKGLTGDAVFKYADDKFTRVIYQTQPDHDPLNRTQLQNKKDVISRTMTMFGSQRTKLNQLIEMGFHDVMAGIASGDKKRVQKGLYSVVVAGAGSGMLVSLINNAFADEDDKDEIMDVLYGGLVAGYTSVIPVFDMLLDPAVKGLMGARSYDVNSPFFDMVNDIRGNITKITSDDDETVAKGLKGMLKTGAQVASFNKYFIDLFKKEENN